MWEIHEQEFHSVLQLGATQRYTYFLKKVADWEKLWSLHDEDSWALSRDPLGKQAVPVWPHPDFALASATGLWDDYIPKPIDIELWIQKWIPGIQRDNRNVAVFPTLDDKGVVISAEQLLQDLKLELSKYND